MTEDEKISSMEKLLKTFSGKKKISGMAKYITLGAFIIIVGFGVAGCFIEAFDMDKYVLFLEKFIWLFVPLIASIGIGSGIKTYKNGKPKNGGGD